MQKFSFHRLHFEIVLRFARTIQSDHHGVRKSQESEQGQSLARAVLAPLGGHNGRFVLGGAVRSHWHMRSLERRLGKYPSEQNYLARILSFDRKVLRFIMGFPAPNGVFRGNMSVVSCSKKWETGNPVSNRRTFRFKVQHGRTVHPS